MVAVPVAVMPLVGAEKITVGALVYPDPAFTIVTPVTAPPLTFAVPVAVVPLPPGAEKVTVGAEEYPDPPLKLVTPATEPVAA
jgi:hypothetical protein